MIKYFVAVLLFGAAFAAYTPLAGNCNNMVDRLVDSINSQIRKDSGILQKIDPFDFPQANVSLGQGYFIGVDSLRRTDDCKSYMSKTSLKVDMHVGLRLMAAGFGKIVIKGQAMSGFCQVRDNSVEIAITIPHKPKKGDKCQLFLDKLEVKRLDKVTLYSSVKEYDNLDLSEISRKAVLPAINNVIEAQHKVIEKILPGVCTWSDLEKQSLELISAFMSQNSKLI